MKIPKLYCCNCQEYKTRKSLRLAWNPYLFKRTLYCKDCNCGSIITKSQMSIESIGSDLYDYLIRNDEEIIEVDFR